MNAETRCERRTSRRAILRAICAGFLSGAAPTIAQQERVFRIGWLSLDRPHESAFFEPFRTGLRDLGYVEGKNVVVDARWGEESSERMDGLARELVQARPQVIVTQGGALWPVLRADAAIPIVFGYSGDPVAAGLADSLARPGRNSTGMSFLSLELVAKRIEFLKLAVPALKQIAIIANPEHPGDDAELRASREAAARLGLSLQYFSVRNPVELDNALVAIPKTRTEAFVVFPDAVTVRNRERLAQFGLKSRLPVISGWERFAESGCLMSYGPNLRAVFRRLASFVDRILKGAKAADVPIELPTIVELVVNMRTAKAIGVAVPQSVLVRADRVIE